MEIQERTLKGIMWPLVAGFEFLIILAFIVWHAMVWFETRDAGKKPFQYPTVTVEAQAVERGSFESFINAVGTLKSNESIVLKSPEGGLIKEILFKSGDVVKKDDVLMRLDDSLLKADLQEALAREHLTRTAYDRAKLLFEKQALPKSKKDEALGDFKVAEARVALAKAKLAHTVLKAPFDGILGLKDVSVGAYVKPGEDIVGLDNINPIFIDFNVNEIHIDKVHVGQDLEVEVDGVPHNQYTAKIVAIDPVADKMSHSLKVRALLKNDSMELKPGLFARVKMTEKLTESAMLIPEAALETEGNQEYVFAIIDGTARRAPVKTGRRNGKVIEITAGLEPGIMVVTSGQLRLGEGVPVIVVPEKNKIGYQ